MAPNESKEIQTDSPDENVKRQAFTSDNVKIAGVIVVVLWSILMTLKQFDILPTATDKATLEARLVVMTTKITENDVKSDKQLTALGVQLEKLSSDIARDREVSRNYVTQERLDNLVLKLSKLNPTLVTP